MMFLLCLTIITGMFLFMRYFRLTFANMHRDLITTLSDETLIKKGQKIILTVSGGVDSVVMASLFMKLDYDFAIAHCNFGLRAGESDADSIFVKGFAQKLGVPFFEKSFATTAFSHVRKISIQEAARILRYEWFEYLIATTDFDLYATAHHFDDQIETFFINLFRGTGLSGLRGILPRNGNCIRPLLFAKRKQILDYAIKNHIEYREDSSNKKHDYLRNRIRHLIIPALEKTHAEFRTGMDNTFSALSAAENFISDGIQEIRSRIVSETDGCSTIKLNALPGNESLEFVLFELLKPFNFKISIVRSIIKSLDGQSGKTFYSITHEVVLDRDALLISELNNQDDEVFELEKDSKELSLPLNLSIETRKLSASFEIGKSSKMAFLDFDKLKFPLQIRKYRTGDFFYPLGMKGRKKISDFFIDHKISVPKKRKTWILTSGQDIVWLVGHRIDDRFKITNKTKTAYIIQII